MAYFRNFFLGSAPESEEDNSAEIVERLVERVETCSTIEDRRDALKALRNMAKKHRLAVGTLGLRVFMDILAKERTITELITLTLEILLFVLIGDEDVGDEDELGERLSEVSLRACDQCVQLILKHEEFMPGILSLLEQYEFLVRRVCTRLLTALLRHRGSEVQNSLIGQPLSITRLLDLVHDSREAIRNEAILLLCELSRAHNQVQQLLAYDNAFNILLDVVEIEPLDRDKVRSMPFLSFSLVARLGSLLHSFVFPEENEENAEWPKQRTGNYIFLLQIIRSLVSPDNVQASTHTAQKQMHQNHILSELCRMLLSEIGISVEVLSETVVAVAEIIRGNYNNQEYFASNSLLTAEGTQRPALLVLLLSLTAERQPFKLRYAVFYAFTSYLHENEFGKQKIVETLLPAAQMPDALSTGSLVIQALTSSESVQSWFGSICLLHCLLDNDHIADQLLRVQLSLTMEEAPQSLFVLLARLLLLLVWALKSPKAITRIIGDEDFLNYLSAQITEEYGETEQTVLRGLAAAVLLVCLQNAPNDEKRSTLEAFITRRVGSEACAEAIEGVAATEPFVRVAQRVQPVAKTASDLFLDHKFVKVFKTNEATWIKAVRSKDGNSAGLANNEAIIQSFKDLIKRQDEEISVLKTDYKRTKDECDGAKAELASVADLKKQLDEANENAAVMRQQVASAESLTQQIAANAQWQAEAEKYKQWALKWQSYQLSQVAFRFIFDCSKQNPEIAANIVTGQLQAQVAELESQLKYGYEEFDRQKTALVQHKNAADAWREKCEFCEKELNQVRAELQALKLNQTSSVNNGPSSSNDSKISEELRHMKSEQEDLLVMLADQHKKITDYKSRLRAQNVAVSSDEDE